MARRAGEVVLFGVKFGVMGSRSAHAVDKASVKEARICQMLLPFFVMIEKRQYVLP